MSKIVIFKDGEAYSGFWNYLRGVSSPELAKWARMSKPRVLPFEVTLEADTSDLVEGLGVVNQALDEIIKKAAIAKGELLAVAEQKAALEEKEPLPRFPTDRPAVPLSRREYANLQRCRGFFDNLRCEVEDTAGRAVTVRVDLDRLEWALRARLEEREAKLYADGRLAEPVHDFTVALIQYYRGSEQEESEDGEVQGVRPDD